MNLRGIGYSAVLLGGLFSASHALAAGELVINEYNGVGEAKFLEHDSLKPWEGYDSYFGRIQGNGGNWVELVVTVDHLDIRGWTLEYTNADPDAGTLTFSNDARWSNLRAGTIITIIETVDDLVPEVANLQDNDFNYIADAVGTPFNVDTDFSYDPGNGDWWINAWLSDTSLFTTGAFKTDNDDWAGTIKDDQGNTISGPIGEAVFGWLGGGINSQEVGRLELNPSSAATVSDYDDADNSTFGAPNDWDDQSFVQDFSAIRSWFTITGDLDGDGFVGLSDLDIILNNWNSSDTTADIAGPAGTSPDGFVGLDDLDIVLSNWNAGTPPTIAVPEPTAALTLLTLGATALVRRK